MLKIVNLNFFCERHGKNGRDSHFSRISAFVSAESLIKRLSCTQDVVDAIQKRQNMANQNQKSKFNSLKLKFQFSFDWRQLQADDISTVESSRLIRS